MEIAEVFFVLVKDCGGTLSLYLWSLRVYFVLVEIAGILVRNVVSLLW